MGKDSFDGLSCGNKKHKTLWLVWLNGKEFLEDRLKLNKLDTRDNQRRLNEFNLMSMDL